MGFQLFKRILKIATTLKLLIMSFFNHLLSVFTLRPYIIGKLVGEYVRLLDERSLFLNIYYRNNNYRIQNANFLSLFQVILAKKS